MCAIMFEKGGNMDKFKLMRMDLESLFTHIEGLEKKISNLEMKNHWLVEEAKIDADRIRELRYIKLVEFNNEECWIWQGEEDYLESLVCPVVIRPEQLRAILANPRSEEE